jgi:hypothetical protein
VTQGLDEALPAWQSGDHADSAKHQPPTDAGWQQANERPKNWSVGPIGHSASLCESPISVPNSEEAINRASFRIIDSEVRRDAGSACIDPEKPC